MAGDGRGARSAEALRPLWQGATELIINGDVAELSDAKWRGPAARQVLRLEELCEEDGVRLTFLSGNHDPLITDRRYLRLGGREIFVTHGDMLHPAISPWVSNAAELRALHDDALASLGAAAMHRSSPDQSLEDQALAVQHASNMKWDHMTQHAERGAGPLRRRAEFAAKVARVFWFWHRLPRLASAFAQQHAPDSRFFIFGHIHRAGVWHLGGKVIINTGSYHAPRNPHAVVIEDGVLAFHKVRFDPAGHTLVAKPLQTFDLRNRVHNPDSGAMIDTAA